jgi:hypothetical protein
MGTRLLKPISAAIDMFFQNKHDSFIKKVSQRWEVIANDRQHYKESFAVDCLKIDTGIFWFIVSLLPSKYCQKPITNKLEMAWDNLCTWLGENNNDDLGQKHPIQGKLYTLFVSIDTLTQLTALYCGKWGNRQMLLKEMKRLDNNFKKHTLKDFQSFQKAFLESELYLPVKETPAKRLATIMEQSLTTFDCAIQDFIKEVNSSAIQCLIDDVYDESFTRIFNDIPQGRKNFDNILWKHLVLYLRQECNISESQAISFVANFYNAHRLYQAMVENSKRQPQCLNTRVFGEIVKMRQDERIAWADVKGAKIYYYSKRGLVE